MPILLGESQIQNLQGPSNSEIRHLSWHEDVITGHLKLLLGEEPAVGQVGPLVLQVDDALDLGLEGLADLVQQIGQGAVIGSLLDGLTGIARPINRGVRLIPKPPAYFVR